MTEKIIPATAARKEQFQKSFQQIAAELEKNQLDKAIFNLFQLSLFIEKNIKPYVGRGKRLATDKVIYDFSCSDAIRLISQEFPGLEISYNDKTIKNGAILMEVLQTCLNQAAMNEDMAAITNLTCVSTMFKVFAGVTKNDFCKVVIDLEKDVDPIAAKLNLEAIIKPAGYVQMLTSFSWPYLYKPVAIAQQVYTDYVSPLSEKIIRPRFK